MNFMPFMPNLCNNTSWVVDPYDTSDVFAPLSCSWKVPLRGTLASCTLEKLKSTTPACMHVNCHDESLTPHSTMCY